MPFVLRKSAIDPALFEVVEEDIPGEIEKLGIGPEGSSKFLSGTSDHCREARRERGRKFGGKADAAQNQFFKHERYKVVREIPVGFTLFKIPRRFGSVPEIERWVGEEERRLAKRTAYRLLALKPQSEAELKRKLSRRGFSGAVIGELIGALRGLGFISDASLVNALIEKEVRRGHGPRYIEMKLRSLGLDAAQVRKRVSEEAQQEAIRKLLPQLKNPAAALQRRGFDPELIFRELKNFLHRR